MAMLDELLSIKTFREQQAESRLQVARISLADAHRTEDLATDELARYQDYARQQEDAGYRALFERAVKVRDIAELHQDIAILRMTEQQYRRELDQARAQRESAQTDHQLADSAARDARTTREKFDELVARDHAVRARTAEYREELEYEELSAIVREREEWSETPDA